MFDNPYRFVNLGSNHTGAVNPVKRYIYKFRARHRIYLVTLEVFSFNVAAIKYCDRRDHNNKKSAYRKIFNDGDAFRVISTCLYIMLDFWRNYPSVSFVFYAVPRDIDKTIHQKNFENETLRQKFIQEYKNARFKIYEYAMLNLFPPQSFIQTRDTATSIYLLVNRRLRNVNAIVLQVARYLFEREKLIFELDDLNA